MEEGIFTVTSTVASKAKAASNLASSSSSGAAAAPSVMVPSPRYGSGIVVKQGILYLYGGVFEDKDDRQITFNDFYCIGTISANSLNCVTEINYNILFTVF